MIIEFLQQESDSFALLGCLDGPYPVPPSRIPLKPRLRFSVSLCRIRTACLDGFMERSAGHSGGDGGGGGDGDDEVRVKDFQGKGSW